MPQLRLESLSAACADVTGPPLPWLGEALDDYHAFPATRADLLQRLGRSAGAREIDLAGNSAEVAYLHPAP